MSLQSFVFCCCMNGCFQKSTVVKCHYASLPTSFRVVAVGSVVARPKALPMMHHHSGEFVEEVLGAW